MKKKFVVLACMFSVFAIGGGTVYAAASGGQLQGRQAAFYYAGSHHNECFYNMGVEVAGRNLCLNSDWNHCQGNGNGVSSTGYIYPSSPSQDVVAEDTAANQAVEAVDTTAYTTPYCGTCGGYHDGACPSLSCGTCGGYHDGACPSLSCGTCGGYHDGACPSLSCGTCGGYHDGACPSLSCGTCGGYHDGVCPSLGYSGGGHHGGGHHGGGHH